MNCRFQKSPAPRVRSNWPRSARGSDGAAKFITVGEDEHETSWLSALKTGYIGVIIGSLIR